MSKGKGRGRKREAIDEEIRRSTTDRRPGRRAVPNPETVRVGPSFLTELLGEGGREKEQKRTAFEFFSCSGVRKSQNHLDPESLFHEKTKERATDQRCSISHTRHPGGKGISRFSSCSVSSSLLSSPFYSVILRCVFVRRGREGGGEAQEIGCFAF